MSWKDMLGVNFLGLENEDVTFLLDPAITRADEGKVVKISANGTVAKCADGDVFYGQLTKVDASPEVGAIRQCDDFIEVTYTGAPGLNYQHLVADANGGVRPAAGQEVGRPMFVISIDAGAGKLIMSCC